MGIFFSSGKKINREEFRKVLRSIPDLSDMERSYVEGIFQDSLKENGISKEELQNEIRDLKHNSNDPLDSYEVEKIKRKLEEYFK